MAASADNTTAEASHEAAPAPADQSSCRTNAASVKPHANQRKRADPLSVQRSSGMARDFCYEYFPREAAEIEARLAAGEAVP
jgi:hypothetical protein